MEDTDFDNPEVPLLLEQGYDLSQNQEEETPHENLGVESLDYEPIHSILFEKHKRRQRQRKLYGYTGLTLAKWSITILIGLLVGLIAYVIESSQEVIITYKKEWTQKMIECGLWLVFLAYASAGVLMILLSSCLVIFWAPAAAGGGVTLVMAYLNGNDIPDFFRHETLFTKRQLVATLQAAAAIIFYFGSKSQNSYSGTLATLVDSSSEQIFGTICTVSSGLPIGQEGPMVHIGAAIASSLTWMHGKFPTSKRGNLPLPQNWWERLGQFTPRASPFDFFNDKDRREFISAGTAAGLAAAFGAPIGGVLFSMEEASSFWSRKVMWRSLLCTTCATMVLSWLHQRQFSLSLPGNISFHGLQPEYDLIDIPLFVVTSVGAGALGAFLNIAHGWLSQFRPSSRYQFSRVAEACIITFICISVIFMLPHFFGQCLPIQPGQVDSDYWFRYGCPEPDSEYGASYYNDLASLFFSVPHQTIQQLLALGGGAHSPFSVSSLAIYAGSFMLLFILAYGIATPGGIFMPSIMVGASFGACLGRIYEIFFPLGSVQPGMHALVGATAMLGGVFRTSISLVVIMVEGTGGIDFILPVILAIVLSNWVAHHIHSAGAYESDLERLGEVHFLQCEPPQKLHAITAADIMAPTVICFKEIDSISEIVRVLRETSHNGFPIIRHTHNDLSNPDGQLVGVILRHQVMLLLEQRAIFETDSAALQRPIPTRYALHVPRLTKEMNFLERAMRVYHHYHHPHRRYLNSRPEAVDDLDIDELLQEFAQPVPNGSSSVDIEEGGSNQEKPVASNSKTELAVDLRPWMNRAPLTVRGETSVQRVYVIFRTLGMRHLCVTDASNRVIGMITRKDIAEAHKNSDPETPRQPDFETSRSFFKSFGQRSSFNDRTPRDVLFSLP